MAQKIYRAMVINHEGKQGIVQFVAQSLSDVEFVVTSDPNNYEILNLELVGAVGQVVNGVPTVEASSFRKKCEQAEGGYPGMELFPAE